MFEELQCYKKGVDAKAKRCKNESIVWGREEQDDEDVERKLEQGEDQCIVAHHVQRESKETPVVKVTLESLHSHEAATNESHWIYSC